MPNSIQLSSVHPELIQKNINDYSFTKELINNVNNFDFKQSAYETLSGTNDTEYSYIWTALSNIVENNSTVSTLLHNNISYEFENDILNYIDNISDIDTCKIKALQSMISQLGVNYTIFDKIKLMPLQIVKILDVLSIKKEYLLESSKVNEIFSKLLFDQISSDLSIDPNISLSATALTECRMSSEISSTNEIYLLSTQLDNISVDYKVYIDDEKLYDYTLSTYAKVLSSFCYMRYNNQDFADPIFMYLSSNILLSDFVLQNTNNVEVAELNIYRLKYNVKNTFNESYELDKIENGFASYDAYSIHEQYLLSVEAKYRAQPFDSSKLYSRYYYYREKAVREYFKFVENEYANYLSLYLSTEQYNIDNNYLIVANNIKTSLLTEDGAENGYLNNYMIDHVAQVLTEITESIRDVREQIKTHIQRNFIKGTKNHIAYVVREYIRNNIYLIYEKLANSSELSFNLSNIHEYNISDVIINVNEYIDPTEYFNISTSVDALSNNVNQRYWEEKSILNSIAPYNSTNIFKKPSIINSATKQVFSQKDIEQLYKQNLQIYFNTSAQLSNSTVSNYYDDDQNNHLSLFLNSVYNSGADTTYQDISGNICCDLDIDLQPDNIEQRQYKETLFKKYSGQDSGTQSFYNTKNQRHPSYQIHPYVKSFVQKSNFEYPLENIANIISEKLTDLLVNNISNYIDNDGYIINTWNTQLNSNSDYLSEYEKSANKTPLNTVSKQIDYDGLFYPEAIKDFIDNSFSFISSLIGTETSYSNIWYKDLNLSYYERQRIGKQLHDLEPCIIDTVSSNYDIYRYGKDFYGNAYILLKDLSASSFDELISMTPDEKKDISGIMWMKIKNHPIALPMMVYSTSNLTADPTLDADLTQIEKTASNIEVIQNLKSNTKFDEVEKYKIPNDSVIINTYVPTFYDFTISKDKTELMFYCKLTDTDNTKYILHANAKKVYFKNIPDQRFKYYFILNNFNNNINTLNDADDTGFEILSNFNFINFYNFDSYVGAVLADATISAINSDLSCLSCHIELPYYDKYDLNNINVKDQLKLDCVCDNCAVDALDDYKIDVTNKKRLTIAYRTKDFDTELSVNDYLGMKLDYANISSPTIQRLNVFTNSLKTIDYRFDNKQFIKIDFDRTYIPYNDLGFIPLYEYLNEDEELCANNLSHVSEIFKKNDINKNGYYYECLSAKGQLKFNLVGRSDISGIFFKDVCPVRTIEGYEANLSTINAYLPIQYHDKLSIVNYFDVHYSEMSTNAQLSSADANIYSPYEFQQKINNYDLTARLDESYFSVFKTLSSRYNFLSSNTYINSFNTVPYIWYANLSALSDFTELYNPGVLNQQICADCSNTYVIQLPNSRTDAMSADIISVNYILSENNSYGDGIKLDFNSPLYNSTPDQINYFNWKHQFLNLNTPGDTGYLQIWYTDENNNQYSVPGNIYYIKNISDTKPKFILSLSSEIFNAQAEEFIYLVDEVTGDILEAFNNSWDVFPTQLAIDYTTI